MNTLFIPFIYMKIIIHIQFSCTYEMVEFVRTQGEWDFFLKLNTDKGEMIWKGESLTQETMKAMCLCILP